MTNFDKMLNSTVTEIKHLNNEYKKYLQLKSEQSWLEYLIRQKESEGSSKIEQAE